MRCDKTYTDAPEGVCLPVLLRPPGNYQPPGLTVGPLGGLGPANR